jgi:N-terminal acetyltransferase B complex catalytic subunit
MLSDSLSYKGYFVDLFVRAGNSIAITMYEKMGYVKYRRVVGYYSGEEDAWGTVPPNSRDMRKALSLDPNKESMVPAGRDFQPHEVDP